MDQKPTVLFVHGAWHTNEGFAQVQNYLSDAGYGIKNVQLPSSTPNGPYVQGIDEDVEVVRNALNDVVETESDIILVVHSYGGIVGSSAAKGFWKKQRREKDKDGGIVHMVFISAVALDEGVSVKDGIGGKLPPWLTIHVHILLWLGRQTANACTGRELIHDISRECARDLLQRSIG